MPALNHPHPGTTIFDLVIKPLGLSFSGAAEKLGVSPAALVPVFNGQAPITDELARSLELAGFSTARFWLALQAEYDAQRAGSINDVFGLLSGKTNGVKLTIEEINEAIAEAGAAAGCAGIKPRDLK